MKKNIHIKINEFLNDQSIEDDELLEMSNLWGEYTGLDYCNLDHL
jgi:predicted Zn-dependent protease with MMP-like domain